jgi:hypothetical protein
MIKKMYAAPAVKSEDVVLGVFGNYSQPVANGHKPKSMFNSWAWIFRFMRWK